MSGAPRTLAEAARPVEPNKASKKRKPEVKALLKGVSDKKTRAAVTAAEDAADVAHGWRERSHLLLPEEAGELEAEGMERTFRFKQDDMREAVSAGAARNMYDLSLPDHGPYKAAFSRNGRHMILAGHKGHVAVMDCLRQSIVTEYYTKESTRDAVFLHNMTFHALAQKKYVYIYDAKGTEIHCLKSHLYPRALEFLPYHFLLASVGNTGFLKYQDTSTGQLVAEHRTKLGSCDVIRQNPANAVLALGHSNGCVTLWTPNMSTAVVKMLCHAGPVRAIGYEPSGVYMVTTGADARMKIWDARMFRPVHDYFTVAPGASLDVSQRGMIAVAHNSHVQIWKDAWDSKASAPYLNHSYPGSMVESVRFRPYEDILGVGHTNGVSTMLVPGAGEPNYDTYEADPFQTRKQRREQEVHAVMDKLPSSTIVMDPKALASLDRAPDEIKAAERKAAKEAADASKKPKRKRKKMRGRSKPVAVEAQKQVRHDKKIREKVREASKGAAGAGGDSSGLTEEPVKRSALSRFESPKK